MKLRLGMISCAAVFALVSCMPMEDSPVGNHPSTRSTCSPDIPTQVTDVRRIRVINDLYWFDGTATVQGDVLCIGVRYSGGCAEHQFSFVVQSPEALGDADWSNVQGMLLHNSNDDACEAMISSKAGIDLMPLKEEFRRQTGQQSGSIRLTISGHNESQEVVYTF